jgi:nitrous oxide reductase accessory protein NosL
MKKLLLIGLLAVLFAACKKDKEEPIPFQVADYPIELVGEWLEIAMMGDSGWAYKHNDY